MIVPDAPTGLGKVFGRKKHEQALAEAATAHELAVSNWERTCADLAQGNEARQAEHEAREVERLRLLDEAQATYEKECQERSEEAQRQSEAIDQLIANLGYGDPEAVDEYVSIALSNSVYPEHFEVGHEFRFDPVTAELSLRVEIPAPDTLPDTKNHRYVKAKDEISASKLSQKAQKDRYASAVQQVALRSLHEVFEADRRELIQTIALEVGTTSTNPATGLSQWFLFIAVGAERGRFCEIDLRNVVPAATLDHLGAAISKNPFGLVEVQQKGVRST